jgi:hypothetical protein
MRYLVLLVALASIWSPVNRVMAADQLTAGDLSEFCRSNDLAVHNACKFFILGAFQGVSLADGVRKSGKQYVDKVDGKNFCVPDDISSDAMEFLLRDDLSQDLEFYPDDKHATGIKNAQRNAIGFSGYACVFNYIAFDRLYRWS